MLKKLAAFGLTAALAFAPVAGFAQATTPDTTAPAADAKPAAEKPMKKHKHHASKKHMKKKMEAPEPAPTDAPKS